MTFYIELDKGRDEIGSLGEMLDDLGVKIEWDSDSGVLDILGPEGFPVVTFSQTVEAAWGDISNVSHFDSLERTWQE